MYALATVVEIDNRLTGHRRKDLVPIAPPVLFKRLQEALFETDPDTGELVWADPDPFGHALLNAYVCFGGGAARIVIWPTSDCETAADPMAELPMPLPGDERGGEYDLAAELDLRSMRMLKNLAENVRRRMGRAALTLERLAQEAGVCMAGLTELIDGVGNPCLTIVSALAEYFGTTMDALMAPPEEERAG
jgi:DNA-binding XRE family transcriptional regulator